MANDLVGVLCILVFILGMMTVVGHGLWVLAAWILKALSGQQEADPVVPSPPPQANPRQELEITARNLARLMQRGILPPQQYQSLMQALREIVQPAAETLAAPIAPSPAPSAATFVQPLEQSEVIEAILLEPAAPGPILEPPTRWQKPPEFIAAPVRTPQQILQSIGSEPATRAGEKPRTIAPAPPPIPTRPLADILQSFMEESNIRWGEVIAGLLIVVSAVGLVISLQATLKKIPYFPAILFMTLTVAFFGAGMYTLRRWKLHAISRVILIISLLLVPLSVSAAIVLSGGGDQRAAVTDPTFLAAVVLGMAVFGGVTFVASREIVGDAVYRLSAGVLGCSFAQILIHRLVDSRLELWSAWLLAAWPLGTFLTATVGQIVRSRERKQLAARHCIQAFIVLGIALFAFAAPLALWLHQVGRGQRLGTLADLSPLLGLAAGAVLGLGLVIHRLTNAKALASFRTMGTAIAILGGLLMVGMVSAAWPRPELLIAVGVLNALLLAGMAEGGKLPILHAPAVACAALAGLVGFHLGAGAFASEPPTSADLLLLALRGRSGWVLTAIAGATLGIGWGFLRWDQKAQGIVYAYSAAALGGLSIAIALCCGFAPVLSWEAPLALHGELSAPLLLFYAAALLMVGYVARQAAATWGGAALLWCGVVQAIALNATLRNWLEISRLLPERPVFCATLLHSAALLGLALLAARRWVFADNEQYAARKNSQVAQTFINPAIWGGLLSLLAATPFILWVYDEAFAWHAGYALVAAFIFSSAALVWRWPAAIYGVQAMLAAAGGFATAANFVHHHEGVRWYLDLHHVHAQMLVVASGAIVWSLVRRLTSPWPTVKELLSTNYPAVDQLLLASVVRLTPLLALFGVWHGLMAELGFSTEPQPAAIAMQAALACGGEAWLTLLVVAGALFLTAWEKVSWPVMTGLALALFAIPWFIASWFAGDLAVASAARWSVATFGVASALMFFLREPLLTLLRQVPGLNWGKLRQKAHFIGAAIPLLLGGLPVLLMTILAVMQSAAGVSLGGPAADSWFGWIGPTASYAGPMLLIVAMLLGYAVCERQSLFAAGGSAMFQLTANLAFILYCTNQPSLSANERVIVWFQWNSIAAGLYGAIWLLLGRWMRPAQDALPSALAEEAAIDEPAATDLAQGMIGFQIALAGVLAAPLVIWSASVIIASPPSPAVEIGPLGGWLSYVSVLTPLALAVWYGWARSMSEQKNAVAALAAALMTLAAASSNPWDGGGQWVAFHTLTCGWLLVAGASAIAAALAAYSSRNTDQKPSAWTLRVPAHYAAALLGMLVVFLAIRGNQPDPGRPWWSAGATFGVAAITLILGLARRSQPYAYLSVLLTGLVVVLYWFAGALIPWTAPLLTSPSQPSILGECLIVAMLSISGVWLALEVWTQFHEGQSFDVRFPLPPIHRATTLAAVAGLGVIIGLLTLSRAFDLTASWQVVDQTGMAAIVITALLLVASLWDRGAWYAIPATFCLGLIAVLFGVDQLRLPPYEEVFVLGLGVAIYLALAGQLWTNGANLAAAGSRLLIHDPVAGLARTASWLPGVTLVLAALVCAAELVAVHVLERKEWRVAAACGPLVAAWAIACLTQQKRRDTWQTLSLLIAGLTLVYLGWAQLEPGWSAAALLLKSFSLLMALAALTLVYGLALPRFFLVTGPWLGATRRAGAVSAAAALATFLVVLALELALFQPGAGAPVVDAQVAAVAVVLVGLIAGLISMALLPGRDPLALSERGRMGYVYGAQATAALLFVHLYICRPYWFDQRLMPYWPYIVMLVAFGGVGIGELFARRKMRVLAEPFQRLGAFLPILPAIGIWLTWPNGDRALLLFVAGILYLLLSMLHRSWLAMAAAALAGNGALWVLLGRHDFQFADHPQFWLIPPAVSVLAAAQINRQRLDAKTLAAIRYPALIAIYLSSTSEIFIRGIATIWPPLILLTLALLGALAGVVLRVRAFLYLGVGFVLLALVSMVWHAARAINETWPWWVFGFATGIALLTIFAILEKQKEEVRRWIGWLRQWDR